MAKLTQELKNLGFTNKKGVVGCNTVPCFQGKHPYISTPTVPCAIIQSMCSKSPVEQMKEAKSQ